MDLFNERSLPFSLPEEEGYSVQWDDEKNGFYIEVPNGLLFYSKNFFNKKISDRSVEYFLENNASLSVDELYRNGLEGKNIGEIDFKHIKWKQDSISLYGKTIPLPRLTSWYGDGGKHYTYSGIKSYPNEWNDGLSYLKREVEKVCDVAFNSVLLNWYRNGEDYINWHADDEKELGKNPVIASVNFGETRDFIIRRNDDNAQKLTIPLDHGTLLIMQGELQHFWQHSVPKRKKVTGSRFNLTFRMISHE